MRLDKLLANSGFGSRKDVKKLLKQGGVRIDGETVKDAKFHVDPEAQEVLVYGERVEYKEFIYLMMNKPKGVISATEDHEHDTVIDLLEDTETMFEPFPVGRLDKDTEGFLIITNDGKLAHELMSPKKNVKKTYEAVVLGEVNEQDVEAFKKGITLDDGYCTKPADLVILSAGPKSVIQLTITEGKFHQVKRMFLARDKRVLELKRLSIGNLALDDTLALGSYRELTEEELAILRGE